MKPLLEHLPASPDASWSMLNRRLDDAIPFEWHHHPEFELTLTLNSRGQRFIGNHVAEYDHGDLVLIGPDLPHTWASREKLDETKPHVALVFWFRREWIDGLTGGSVELAPIRRLISDAGTALAFDPALGRRLSADFEALFLHPPAQRLIGLLTILARLAEERTRQPLSSVIPQQHVGDRSRIDRVLVHIHKHYHAPLRMEELAEIAFLSVSGLHRLFQRHTQMSVSEYVIALRIGESCSRLSGTNQPIQHIAAEVGYASLANFNRQFRRLRGMSPREYRMSFRR
ncbi:AraC family transcriptional regulator [Brucella ciceri]|uniref:helix-turn-helix domain-containing protein n=1 Tax=Brucella ciceri TaxID=391287 RepID=UPI000DD83042|nr:MULTISPECIES: AraC family transcriptional regulator [Brucella/Ochrobactrum group]MBA8846011.1 AraC-like DNA-binding protein [Ochrobactrum sp. RH1CCR137]MBA8857832.1 AraC-like DNA-binding protein [Ochrobactrum sp. RH1CCR134]MCH6205785.1 AraC family transcriptional regulator [Brucella ciceri]